MVERSILGRGSTLSSKLQTGGPIRQALLTPGLAISSPSGIPGLELWLDADDQSTITSDISGIISQWDDKSPTGASFSQGTFINKPSIASGAQNSRDAIDFDGLTLQRDILVETNAANFLSSNAGEIFIAYDNTGTPLDDIMMSFGRDLGSPMLTLTAESAFNNKAPGLHFKPDAFTNHRWGGGVSPGQGTHIMNVGSDGSEWFFGIDGNDLVATSGQEANIGTWWGGISPANGFAFGSRFGSSSNSFDGLIFEVIVYSGVLTSSQRTAVYNYLGNRWSISV